MRRLALPPALRRVSVLAGLALVGVWVICALFAPLLAPLDPLKNLQPLAEPLSRDEDGHFFWLGSDMLGRDILSRLIYGARTVIIWAGLATLTAYVIGIACGLLAGFYRGLVDRALSFLANVVLSFPVLVLYILIISKLGASGFNIVLAVTFASAPAIFRIVRALALDLRERDFVLAAVTQGESALRIMLLDMLPNAAGPLTVDACLRLGYTAITIGVLGFLGLGLPPPTPDWGGMVNEGRPLAFAFPYLIIFPCVAISSLMLGLSLLADGLRDPGPASFKPGKEPTSAP